MNQRKNGMPQGFGANPLHSQRRSNPQTHKPLVMQPKTATTLQMKNQPVAPPVYRPQPSPKVLQAKSALGQQSRAGGQPPRPPVAPPVYRPQSVTRVLQAKVASGQPLHAGQAPRQPVAPPVYRPEPKRIVQTKMATSAQAQKLPKSPPVYRPQPTPRVLQTKDAHMGANAPVNSQPKMPHGQRVAARRAAVQAKVIQRNINSTNFEKTANVAPLYMVNPQARGTLYSTTNAPPPRPFGLYTKKADVDDSDGKNVFAWTPNVRFLSKAEMEFDLKSRMYDGPDGKKTKLDVPGLFQKIENPRDDDALELPFFGILGKNDCAGFAHTLHRNISRQFMTREDASGEMQGMLYNNSVVYKNEIDYPDIGIGDMMRHIFSDKGKCGWHGATVVAEEGARQVTLEAHVSKDITAPEFHVRSGVSGFVADNLRESLTEKSRTVEITKYEGGLPSDMDLKRYESAKYVPNTLTSDVGTSRPPFYTKAEMKAFDFLGRLLNHSKWDTLGHSFFSTKTPDGIKQMRDAFQRKRYLDVFRIARQKNNKDDINRPPLVSQLYSKLAKVGNELFRKIFEESFAEYQAELTSQMTMLSLWDIRKG